MSHRGSALRYHDATKHSEISLRASAHYLDWDSKPSPFKVYKDLVSVPLARDFPRPKARALAAIRGQKILTTVAPINIKILAELLFFSAGLTRRMRFGSETHYMRAASATGALYPIELYVIVSEIDGLNPGVYHFNPLDFALVQIREGDYSSIIAEATGNGTRSSPATIALTCVAWRNAWKYEARSYRHWFWDAGVIAANLLAISSSEHFRIKLISGFVDAEIDKVLGLTPEQEATVALAAIGQESKISGGESPALQQIHPAANLQYKDEVTYPIIWELNRASELHKRPEVEEWRHGLHPSTKREAEADRLFPLKPLMTNSPALGDVILRRGSTRRFAQKPISFEALSTIIDSSAGSIPLDFLSNNDSLIESYLIANDVEQLPEGAYHYNRSSRSLEQLKDGKLRYVSGYLCLEQPLFSDASVVFFLMADLSRVLADLGDRGYRAAQFEAGIRAGRIYLSSYALGVGASGSTFFDDAVTDFFSPHAKDLSVMIAVGVGVPAYKAKPGKILPQFASK